MGYLLVCVLVSHVHGQFSPVVKTTIGSVQGLLATDGDYFSYYNIPYGGPTGGVNRFKEPTPPLVFEKVYLARNADVVCVQPGPNGPIGEEDCLTLSVFTKNVTSSKSVVVWLISEEYTTSHPLQHSFRNIVEEDIVVVAINYRLSVFGFLCLGIEEAPGNAGLKDVLQGLKWIQDNIAAFGGDPNNVALFGHGSGAAMVDLITISPLAKNLVHKAIFHSGSSLAPWAISYDPIGSAQDLRDVILEERSGAQRKGFRPIRRPNRPFIVVPLYTRRKRQEMVDVLRGATVNELMTAVNQFEFTNNAVLFAPCLENVELNPNNTFLHEAPIKLLESGEYLHIPIIAGYTDLEGSVRVDEAINGQWLKEMENDFRDFLPPDLELDEDVEENVTQTIREFYFGNRIINITWINDFFAYNGDTMTVIPVIRSVIARGWTSEADVRLLEFKHTGSHNSDWAVEDVELNGVPHGGILNYILDFDLLDSSARVRISLVNRYVEFMNTCDIHECEPTNLELDGVTWFPISSFQEYIEYSGGVYAFVQRLMQNPHRGQYGFWSDLYRMYYRMPTPLSAANTMAVSLLVLFSFVLNIL